MKRLAREEFEEIIKTLRLDSVYRAVGSGRRDNNKLQAQHYICKPGSFWKYYELLYGEDSFFSSMNSFPDIYMIQNEETGRIKPVPANIKRERLLIDQDDLNERRLGMIRSRLTRFSLESWLMKTGGRGFQFQTPFKPDYKPYFEFEDKNRIFRQNRSVIKHIFRRYINEKPNSKKSKVWRGIAGIDLTASADGRRIARVPGAMYYNKNHETTGRHTVLIRPNDFDAADEYSKENIQHLEDVSNDITIEKFIEENEIEADTEIEVPVAETAKGFGEVGMVEGPQVSVARWYLDLIAMERPRGVFYPCVKEFMTCVVNPPHFIRIAFAIWLFLKLGKNVEQVNYIWEACAETFGYLDRKNKPKRIDQIKSLKNYDRFVSCDKLKDENCCLHDKCPRWRRWNL